MFVMGFCLITLPASHVEGAAKPNLRVKTFTLKKVGSIRYNKVRIHFTVENTGNEKTPEKTTVVLRHKKPGGSETELYSWSVPRLSSKGKRTHTKTFSFEKNGRHYFKLVVDPKRLNPDRSRSNNTKSRSIILKGGLPDFRIQSHNIKTVKLTGSGKKEKVKVTGTAVIINAVDGYHKKKLLVKVTLRSGNYRASKEWRFSPISPGKKRTIHYSLSCRPRTEITVTVAADPHHAIAETNNNNNKSVGKRKIAPKK